MKQSISRILLFIFIYFSAEAMESVYEQTTQEPESHVIPPLQRTDTTTLDADVLRELLNGLHEPLPAEKKSADNSNTSNNKGTKTQAPASANSNNSNNDNNMSSANNNNANENKDGKDPQLRSSASTESIDATDSNQGSLKLIPTSKGASWLPRWNPFRWWGGESDDTTAKQKEQSSQAAEEARIKAIYDIAQAERLNQQRIEKERQERIDKNLAEFIMMPGSKSGSIDKLAFLATYCKQRGPECADAVAGAIVYILDAIDKLARIHCSDAEFLAFSKMQAMLISAYKLIDIRFTEPDGKEIFEMVSIYASKMYSNGIGEGIKFQQRIESGAADEASVAVGEASVEAYFEEVKIITTALLDFYCHMLTLFPQTAEECGIAQQFKELLCDLDNAFPTLLSFTSLNLDELMAESALLSLFYRARELREKKCCLGDEVSFEDFFSVLKLFEVERSYKQRKRPGEDTRKIDEEIINYLNKILTRVRQNNFSPMVLLKLHHATMDNEIVDLLVKKIDERVVSLEALECENQMRGDLAALVMNLVKEINDIIGDYYENHREVSLFEAMRKRVAAVLERLLVGKRMSVAPLLNHTVLILKTRDLFLRPLICELAMRFRPESDSYGKQIWSALIVKYSDLLEETEELARKELLDVLSDEDLKAIVFEKGALEKKRAEFQEKKERKLAEFEHDREEIQAAVAALMLKDPTVVDGTIIPLLDAYAHKHLLLLLTKKLLEHEDYEAIREDLNNVVIHLTRLGDDLRGVKGFQAQHAHKKSLRRTIEKYRTTMAEAQGFLQTTQQQLAKIEDEYEKAFGSIAAVVENHSSLNRSLVLPPRLADETFALVEQPELESEATADDSAAQPKEGDEFDSSTEAPPSVRGETHNLLNDQKMKEEIERDGGESGKKSVVIRVHDERVAQGIKKFATSVESLIQFSLTHYDSENEQQTQELATLLNRKLQQRRILIMNKRKAIDEITASVSWLTDQIERCTAEITALERDQGNYRHLVRDLYDIGSALYAIEYQYPGFISPAVLSQYTNPYSFWSKVCVVM